jgi:hypothetical protein
LRFLCFLGLTLALSTTLRAVEYQSRRVPENPSALLACTLQFLPVFVAFNRGDSWAEYAKRVQVAPQTLAEIVSAEPGVYGDLTNKKTSGRAGTLARVVRFANTGMDEPIELFDVLRALGLAGHEPNVTLGLTRSVTTSVTSEEVEFRTHGDVVLR